MLFISVKMIDINLYQRYRKKNISIFYLQFFTLFGRRTPKNANCFNKSFVHENMTTKPEKTLLEWKKYNNNNNRPIIK